MDENYNGGGGGGGGGSVCKQILKHELVQRREQLTFANNSSTW